MAVETGIIHTASSDCELYIPLLWLMLFFHKICISLV